MPLVAGVDSSTQSATVELRDLGTGRVLGSGRSPHPPTLPPRSEQDPSAWWTALVEAMARALDAARAHGARGSDVAALAVAGQQHGLVALDDRHRPVHPAKLWNDTESAADARRLVDRLGPAAWADACGSVPTAAFTITKLAWLRRCRPDAYARTTTVLLPHDWLTFRLTGAMVTDRGDASGTGYWSPAGERYRDYLLGLVDDGRHWDAALPRVAGPGEAAGGLTRQAAGALGLSEGVPVTAGTGDNMAGALGVGLAPGDIAVSVGTSGTVFGVTDHATSDPTGAVAGFADATGRYLPLVCTLNATRVTDAVARLLGVDHAGFDDLALSGPAGAGGLVLVPYLAGERTPNRPDATGSLHGIRPDVERSHLARAAVEGVVCGLLEGLDALAAAGVTTGPGRLVLLGGGARSAAYRLVLASLAEREVTVPDGDEPVAAGAAVQAAALAGGGGTDAVVEAWDLTAGGTVAPATGPGTAADVRRRYAGARG